jgi:hypothetical protein
MMTLTRVMHTNWHAVERDLIVLGRRADDIGTAKLTLWELISIVVASPVGTAVREAKDGGWSQTDRLIANLGEQHAGVLSLTGRYPRPDVSPDQHQTRTRTTEKPAYGVVYDAMDKDQFVARQRTKFKTN